jgi:hypothetical protein
MRTTKKSLNVCVPGLVALLAVICLEIPWPGSLSLAVASSPAEKAAKGPGHFKVPEPATKNEAVALLKSSLEKIEVSLANGDFDAIHEASYSVEAALARIGKEPGYDGSAAMVAPRCEIVHLASEMQDEATLKAAVPILIKAARDQFLVR